MINLQSISKKYPKADRLALSDVSFSVTKGEIVGLLGENGAGKSTLLMILSTLIKPSEGAGQIMNYDIARQSGKIRRHIGVYMNNQNLYERLTGRENIKYYAGLYNLKKETIHDRISMLSDIFQMNDYIDKPVSKYSGGMKQKVSLARMLVHDPLVLLLDEPTTGIDLSSLYIFLDFIAKCRENSKVVVFSSHNLNDISRISDRVIILHKGRLIDQGSIDNLCSKYNSGLEQLYLNIIRDIVE